MSSIDPQLVRPGDPVLKELPLSELVLLADLNPMVYSHHFFPKTFRQASPLFHRDCWELLEDPLARYVAIKIFRDGAKTTLLRTFVSKRIAYGVSRTILFVGKSETAAMKSIDWLQRAVLYNRLWATTFGLSKGKQWSGSEIDIYHGQLDINIRIIAMGITGSTRGINIDDYRPDLIIVDDPCDLENTATPEQRFKINELFFGGLKESLAPTTDMPEAKMALLQTPLDGEDLIEKAVEDPQWKSMVFSCFTEDGESSWADRYPKETLLEEKAAYIARNQLSIWMREKEVTITSKELCYFQSEWLQYWDVLPEGGLTFIGIDPTPPPKEGAKVSSAKLDKLDDAVILVIRVYKKRIYLCDYYCTKSPNPVEFIAKFFEMARQWGAMKIGVETVLFQRMLKVYIEQEMQRRSEYYTITAVEDKRKKETRILQAVSNRASNRTILVHKSHTAFISQYTMYPQAKHDDILDAFSIALSLVTPALEALTIDGEYSVVDESEIENLPATWRSAP
jgi:predicted phage terminase large subunit-like protein